MPRWLRRWRGDGIISRTIRKADTTRLLATGLPLVELYAYNDATLPSVHPDETAVARLAAEHFLDRGLRNFAFFRTQRAHWMDGRRRAFEQFLRQSGFFCHCFSFMPRMPSAAIRPRPIDDRSG